jgi:hypothetical protein
MRDPDSPQSRVLTILMIIVGCVMLLPGLCALISVAMIPLPLGWFVLWIPSFAISFAGIALIRWARRRLER